MLDRKTANVLVRITHEKKLCKVHLTTKITALKSPKENAFSLYLTSLFSSARKNVDCVHLFEPHP